jgi:uncharacterized membrane protein
MAWWKGSFMAARKASPERLGAFSDGVIAVIITIMVLDLKAPHNTSPAALFALWPAFAGYAVSYLFVGVVWINHHYLLRYAEHADSPVIWTNLLFLFLVSLIPFSTSYMAENHMDPLPTALYALVFLLITVAFKLFQTAIARQAGEEADLMALLRAARRRNRISLLGYGLAIPAAYLYPAISLVLILGVSLMYFVPDARGKVAHGVRPE